MSGIVKLKCRDFRADIDGEHIGIEATGVSADTIKTIVPVSDLIKQFDRKALLNLIDKYCPDEAHASAKSGRPEYQGKKTGGNIRGEKYAH